MKIVNRRETITIIWFDYDDGDEVYEVSSFALAQF